MNQKVLGSVFVLAVALGMISVTVRSPQTTPDKARAAAPAPKQAAEQAPVAAMSTKPDVPNMARGMASYRVYEYGIERGMDFRGAGYTAQVAETGVRFGTTEGSLLLGTPRFEQGTKPIETASASFAHPGFGVARLERGPVTEEYVFENRRMEQLFRIPAPLGEGALTVRVPLATSFPSVVETRLPRSGKWDAAEFGNGGIAVMDVTGALKFHCTSAVAIDAADNRISLALRHENGEIAMEVPASFMSGATYPVVIDPWFGTNGSNTGGGISNTASASERPAMRNGVIAWADNSSGNFEIYVKGPDGAGGFGEFAGSASGGGISSNAGKSVNPTIALDNNGDPVVAWEDNTGGVPTIYLKRFNRINNNWEELGGSGSKLGVPGTFFVSVHPSVGVLRGVIPGTVSVDGNGVVTSTPSVPTSCPVVAWDSGDVNGSIFVSAFYPGAPAIPAFGGTQSIPAVSAGWYNLGALNGAGVTSNTDSFGFFSPGSGEYPALVVDPQNQVTVAWQGVSGNNYDIFAARWTLPGAVSTTFQITARPIPDPTLDMRPGSNFQGIAGGALSAPDNVSGTAGLSQYPAISRDPFSGAISIAWQETETVPTATSSQIYLRRTTGVSGAAWNPVAASASLGGISRTGLAYDGAAQTPPVAGNASNPSVASEAGLIAVAWEDTSNSRSSICLRQAAVGGLTWDQIGFQGSAFPPRLPLILPPAVPEPAPIAGVSQSPNFSLHPQVQMGLFGPEVCWADGSGATFDIQFISFWPNGPGQALGVGTNNPTFGLTIRQTDIDPTSVAPAAVDVAVGGFSTGTSIWLSSRVFTETLPLPGTSLRLEFEIQPAGVPFTFTPSHQALYVAPDLPPTVLPTPPPTSLAKLKFDGLPNTNYHYITRSIDQLGRYSPWFEQTTLNGVSFRINSVAAPGGGSNGPVNVAPIAAANHKSKGNCGLLGLDAVALLGALSLIRRRRGAKK
jgi:hypothetical protein